MGLIHCCSISPLFNIYAETVGNTRSVLGGCSSGGLGGLVWSWSAVGHRLPSTRMWIFMLQNMSSKQRHRIADHDTCIASYIDYTSMTTLLLISTCLTFDKLYVFLLHY